MTGFLLPSRQGYYYKRGIIYLAIYVNGKKFSYSTGLTGKEPKVLDKLKQFKIDKTAEAKADVEFDVKRGVRVEDIFEAYVDFLKDREEKGDDYAKTGTTTSYRTQSVIRSHLAGFFNSLRPEQVKSKLDEYAKLRHDEGVTAPTWNGELRILRAALRRGMKKGLMRPTDIPLEFPFDYRGERKAKRTGIITREQQACIMREAAPHLKPVFATAILTGMRPKEIRFVRPEQVFLDDDEPRIELRDGETKNSRSRKVALVDDLIPVLREWKRDHPNPTWFFHRDGKQLKEWKTAWYSALVRCGLRVKNDEGKWENTVLFYDSRRTARTRLDEAGVSREDAKKQLGHLTDSQSEDYDKSEAHVKRISVASRSQKTYAPVAVAPALAVRDLKAQLKELKDLFEDGLLPEELYRAEVAKALSNR